jgi:hypothetical protein
MFGGTMDFDPGDGVTEGTSNGDYDVYLSKFAPDGTFLWVKTWGSPEPWPGVQTETTAGGLAIGNSDSIYAAGSFIATCDFNPGDGVDSHSATGYSRDAFLSRFNQDGTHFGTVTWGGEGDDEPTDIALNSTGDVYICGDFDGTTDFDPGAGVHELSSKGGSDAFLSRLSASGAFIWAGTWGSTHDTDHANSVAVDKGGAVYVAGTFLYKVDFDPGPEEKIIDNHFLFVALSKFDSSNSFQWVRAWYDEPGMTGQGSVAVGISGEVYCAVMGDGGRDIDPEPWNDFHTRIGALSRFAPSGELIWTGFSVSSDDFPLPWDLGIDKEGAIYPAGGFNDTVDFDPGLGIDEHATSGQNSRDAYLAKYPPDLYW